MLDLPIHYVEPTRIGAAGRGRVLKRARNRSRKDPVELVDQIFTALAEQTVTVPGTGAAELVIPQRAANVKAPCFAAPGSPATAMTRLGPAISANVPRGRSATPPSCASHGAEATCSRQRRLRERSRGLLGQGEAGEDLLGESVCALIDIVASPGVASS